MFIPEKFGVELDCYDMRLKARSEGRGLTS